MNQTLSKNTKMVDQQVSYESTNLANKNQKRTQYLVALIGMFLIFYYFFSLQINFLFNLLQ